jgi:hypothetical protein
MPDIEAGTIIPNVIFGALILIVGVMTIRFREPLNDAVLRNFERTFGRRVARSAGHQTPTHMGIVGGGFILLGLVMLGFATAGITQYVSS